MDQILRLKQRFNPLLPYHLGSLNIEELKAIARKPYAFETAIRKQRIRLSCLSRLETRRPVDYWGAKIVPGGQWLFTLSTECEMLAGTTGVVYHPILRVWSISPPVPDIPHCVTSLDLRPTFTPLELCLQPGNSSSDLFVLVNCFLVRPQQGRCGSSDAFFDFTFYYHIADHSVAINKVICRFFTLIWPTSLLNLRSSRSTRMTATAVA